MSASTGSFSFRTSIAPRLVYIGGKNKPKGSSPLSFFEYEVLITHFSYCDTLSESSDRYFIVLLQGFQLQYGRNQVKYAYSILFGTRSDVFNIMHIKRWLLFKFSGICWYLKIRQSIQLDLHYKLCLAFCRRQFQCQLSFHSLCSIFSEAAQCLLQPGFSTTWPVAYITIKTFYYVFLFFFF